MKNKAEVLANDFYNAFAQRDSTTMNAYYGQEATFSDPIFPSLNVHEIRGMWSMLCKSAPDLAVTHVVLEADELHAIVSWVATYTFARTGRKVENHVTTHMQIKNGSIFRQEDSFHFPKWARQALGPVPGALAYFPLFQKRVQNSANERLKIFLATASPSNS